MILNLDWAGVGNKGPGARGITHIAKGSYYTLSYLNYSFKIQP